MFNEYRDEELAFHCRLQSKPENVRPNSRCTWKALPVLFMNYPFYKIMVLSTRIVVYITKLLRTYNCPWRALAPHEGGIYVMYIQTGKRVMTKAMKCSFQEMGVLWWKMAPKSHNASIIPVSCRTCTNMQSRQRFGADTGRSACSIWRVSDASVQELGDRKRRVAQKIWMSSDDFPSWEGDPLRFFLDYQCAKCQS